MNVVRCTIYGSFGTQNLMVAVMFKFGLKHERSMSGQTRSNYVKSSNSIFFCTKIAYLVQFCLRIPKNVIYFYVRQLEMPKLHFN